MRVLLIQLDGKLPNLALMRLSAHYKALGASVVLQRGQDVERGFFDQWDHVYASAIFERTTPSCRRLLHTFPMAVIGGTGWDLSANLESMGIGPEMDYTIYPEFGNSIGFTSRGCRLRCRFCKVPDKEGAIRSVATVPEIWRGEPNPRNLLLLDNDFFGQPDWPSRIEEIRSGNFRVSFNQGINVRLLTNEQACAVASVQYYDDQFKTRRIYTAWDKSSDERLVMAGLERLAKQGVNPDHIMVYMLIGYGDTPADRERRRSLLRSFGARPYPMPFTRDTELVGFQRWVVGAYDKRIEWGAWKRANYRPERLGSGLSPLFENGDPETASGAGRLISRAASDNGSDRP